MKTKNKIERVYYHYEKWEDWKHGMYKLNFDKIHGSSLIKKSVHLLQCGTFLYEMMDSVTKKWSFSSEVNLTHTNRNRQAWLGQSACCFAFGTPEELTRIAWHQLTSNEQDKANNVADAIIHNWEKKYTNKNINNQLLLWKP